jgi:hypothetical protein
VTQPLKVAYTHAPLESVSMFTAQQSEVFIRYEGINLAEGGTPIVVELYKVNPEPLKDLALITDKFADMAISSAVLIDSANQLMMKSASLDGSSKSHKHKRAYHILIPLKPSTGAFYALRTLDDIHSAIHQERRCQRHPPSKNLLMTCKKSFHRRMSSLLTVKKFTSNNSKSANCP